MSLSKLVELAKQIDKPTCESCTRTPKQMHILGDWLLCRKCHCLILSRLEPLADILLAPQDEWDEYLNEILRIMFRKQADATLGIVRE